MGGGRRGVSVLAEKDIKQVIQRAGIYLYLYAASNGAVPPFGSDLPAVPLGAATRPRIRYPRHVKIKMSNYARNRGKSARAA